MQIKIGCDLVYIPKFKNSLLHNPHNSLLARIFTPYELHNNSEIQSLAGKFAAKEAVFKALDFLKPGDWHQIEIINLSSGKPIVKLLDRRHTKIVSSDISISHDGDYVMASCCFLIED
jgi:holo-[acyl-carrier protein] synthase